MKPIFFKTPAEFRVWLEVEHSGAKECFVGFYTKDSGRPTMTWSEAVAEALCFGWIDGLVRKIDHERYTRRFTPRRPGSNWSNINIAFAERLIADGKMQAAGLRAFEARTKNKSGVYSYESQESRPHFETFPATLEKIFRADRAAWKHWETSPPGYRRKLTTWVCSAKQETTRRSRLEKLIARHTEGRRLL